MSGSPARDTERYARAADGWQGRSSLDLPYTGVTPIATCHWQWIANILATDGFPNAWESLGLSWGCRQVGPVLFGLASWPRLLRELSGAEVDIRTYAGAPDARADEIAFSDRGWPFVAEVDSHFLAGEHEIGHVVHAVLIVERDVDTVRLVDDRAGPEVRRYSAAAYELMRGSECAGRVEEHKLYVVRRPATRHPSAPELHACIVDHLRETHDASLRTLASYVEQVAEHGAPIDICRAAGERFQATQTFRFLREEGVPETERPTELLSELSNAWYLAYMLTSHLNDEDERIRDRIARIMRRVLETEHELVEVLLHD